MQPITPPFFSKAQAAGWALQRHDMGLDHLWFGKCRATDAMMVTERRAGAELAASIERHRSGEDRIPAGKQIRLAAEALAGGLKQTAAGARLSGKAVVGKVALMAGASG